MKTWESIETPCLLLDRRRLEENIARMQRLCDEHGMELRPHIKTHKMVYVGQKQLEAGAAGLVCSKLSEAEAILPAGVKSVFIANSIVGTSKLKRLQRLAGELDELILGVTSEAHFPELAALLEVAELRLPVMLAVDTGLHREGVRDVEAGIRLANKIGDSSCMELVGLYCHEGHAYGRPLSEKHRIAGETLEKLEIFREAIGGKLRLWPGCSVTASVIAKSGKVDAIRPGAYVFGDIANAKRLKTMEWQDVALTVAATVVDLPEPGMALIDAGSKVFSGDKTPDTRISGLAMDGRDLVVSRVSEEHGFVTGTDAATLKVGEKLRFVVAHVCPAVNLADTVYLIDGDEVLGTQRIEGRGCVR